MSKINKKKVLSILILIVLAAFFFYYIYTHISDFKQLKIANPILLLVLALINLIFTFNNGLITKFLLQPFKIDLKFKEWFGLASITSFYNLITPFKGGAITRAVYLKTKHNFSYSLFLATLSGSYVIIILTACTAGLISTFLIYSVYGTFSWIITLFLIALLLPLLVIVIFSPKVKDTKYPLVNKFINVINGWHSIKSNKKVIFSYFFLSLFNLVLGTFGSIVTYKVLGIHLNLAQALFMTSVGSLSVLVSITPGGLGINEAIAVLLASLVGITPAQSLAASIIGRAVGIIVIFILGPIFSYLLMKNTLDAKSKK